MAFLMSGPASLKTVPDKSECKAKLKAQKPFLYYGVYTTKNTYMLSYKSQSQRAYGLKVYKPLSGESYV